MIPLYTKKKIFTPYTYYFFFKALSISRLSVVGRGVLPTTFLLPNPLFWAENRKRSRFGPFLRMRLQVIPIFIDITDPTPYPSP